MKEIRMLSFILVCVLIMLSLSGCGLFRFAQNRLGSLASQMMASEKQKLETTNSILRCFSEKDVEAFKAMFCIKTQELSDIDEQIQSSFDLVKGKIISFDKDDLLGYKGESIDDGRIIELDRAWSIKKIETDENVVCEIYVHTYVINEKSKDKEGLTLITITTSDGVELSIGYKWPDYQMQGNEIVWEAIRALDDNDKERLRVLFCSKTLSIENIDKQIEEGIEFYEGEATWGKVGTVNGRDAYDGTQGFSITVKENEIIEKNKPISTSLTVLISNIKTYAGKTYEIEFYADLLNEKDESLVGITQMKIMCDGIECIIGAKYD